jgi:hypothetical protein
MAAAPEVEAPLTRVNVGGGLVPLVCVHPVRGKVVLSEKFSY